MHQFKLWYYAQPKAIRILLSINVVVYLLWQVIFIHFEPTQRFFLSHLALNPAFPDIVFQPWQLITYSFLHLEPGLGGLLHVGFNMAWMVWIGRDYETLYGPGRLLGIYMFGAVGGALMTVLLHFVFPSVGVFGGIVHGASGAVLAIMTMVAIHQPEQRIGLMFIGIVRLIHVVIGFIALDILFLSSGGTSVSAHLGGVLAGLLTGKLLVSGLNPTSWADVFFHQGYPAARSGSSGGILHRMEYWLDQRNKTTGGVDSSSRGSARIYQMNVDKKGSSKATTHDIDAILDKISATGYDSLSKAEKEALLKEGGEGK
jgi:membrane associated rhomboid family serine protease